MLREDLSLPIQLSRRPRHRQYVLLTSESFPPSPFTFFAAYISSLGSSAAENTVVFALPTFLLLLPDKSQLLWLLRL
ncbi:hypothetical protein Bca4012_055929 [Brassica carinata]